MESHLNGSTSWKNSRIQKDIPHNIHSILEIPLSFIKYIFAGTS